MKIKILYIEDDKELQNDIVEFVTDHFKNLYSFEFNLQNDLKNGLLEIDKNINDLIILDVKLTTNNSDNNDDKEGVSIFEHIKTKTFTPIIFYTANSKFVDCFESFFVKVVTKGDAKELCIIIEKLFETGLPKLHSHLSNFFTEKIRDYFWDVANSNEFKSLDITQFEHKYLFHTLILKYITNSITQNSIKEIFNLEKSSEIIHPLEYYIYPINKISISTGLILKKEEKHFIILTPDCDLVDRNGDGVRKAEYILLIEMVLFSLFKKIETVNNKIKKLSKNNSKIINTSSEIGNSNNIFEENLAEINKLKLKIKDLKNSKDVDITDCEIIKNEEIENVIKNNHSSKDRYFFLPKTPFIDNFIIDFQNKVVISYEDVINFNPVAKVDTPYLQSILSTYNRYYNRVGVPDLNLEIIKKSI